MDTMQTKIVTKEMAFPASKTFTAEELSEVYNANPNTYLVYLMNSNSADQYEPFKYRATSLKALKELLNKEWVEGTECQIYKQVSIFKGNFITQ